MNEELKQLLEEANPEVLMAGKTMSICAAYISESLIAASISELRVVLLNRWSQIRELTVNNTQEDNDKVERQIEDTVRWGVKAGALERSVIPGKYSPTKHGWQIGKMYLDTILQEIKVAGSPKS